MDRMILKAELASLTEHTYFFQIPHAIISFDGLTFYYHCVDSFCNGLHDCRAGNV